MGRGQGDVIRVWDRYGQREEGGNNHRRGPRNEIKFGQKNVFEKKHKEIVSSVLT